MKLRTLVAAMVAIGLTSLVAAAGYNSRQLDTGAFCLQETVGATSTDRWCLGVGGVQDVTAGVSANSAATNDMLDITMDTPVDTTGTNTHNALTIDIGIGNATGGTNTARGIQIDAIAGDAQVTTQGINIGNMTGTGGTEDALVIGTGWDDGIEVSSDVNILVENLYIGNGTPGETINGEDLYVEGISEFDGTANFDGTADFDGAITIDSTTVAENGVKYAGRGYFEVCGDIATVNANTVYYGPSQAVIDSATAGGAALCNTDSAGSTTEATADEPPFPSRAWVPLGMVCYVTDMGATGSPLTYTLRVGAAAYDAGAITMSIADNVLAGVSPANTIGTTEVAADSTVAVALTSSGDVGAGAFVCRISYAF